MIVSGLVIGQHAEQHPDVAADQRDDVVQPVVQRFRSGRFDVDVVRRLQVAQRRGQLAEVTHVRRHQIGVDAMRDVERLPVGGLELLTLLRRQRGEEGGREGGVREAGIVLGDVTVRRTRDSRHDGGGGIRRCKRRVGRFYKTASAIIQLHRFIDIRRFQPCFSARLNCLSADQTN